MATLGQDFRAFIVGSTSIAAASTAWTITKPGVVELDKIGEQPPRPRVWMQRRRENEELDLSGNGGLVESTWDLEIISTDHSDRYSITNAIKRRLNGHEGTMGTRTVQGIFVEDHDDDYLPRGLAGEDAFYLSALSATIWAAST